VAAADRRRLDIFLDILPCFLTPDLLYVLLPTLVPAQIHQAVARRCWPCTRPAARQAARIIDVVEKTSEGTLDPQQSRAMMDGLKWAAERMAPKRHSARQEIDHRSTDGSMSPKSPRELTDTELQAIINGKQG